MISLPLWCIFFFHWMWITSFMMVFHSLTIFRLQNNMLLFIGYFRNLLMIIIHWNRSKMLDMFSVKIKVGIDYIRFLLNPGKKTICIVCKFQNPLFLTLFSIFDGKFVSQCNEINCNAPLKSVLNTFKS